MSDKATELKNVFAIHHGSSSRPMIVQTENGTLTEVIAEVKKLAASRYTDASGDEQYWFDRWVHKIERLS